MADVRMLEKAFAATDCKYTLEIVEDGEQALQRIFSSDELPPDLIILDLNLMKIDGREVLRRVKEIDCFEVIPVVILTTSKDADDVVYAYRNGAAAYVSKPYGYEEFIAMGRALAEFWFNRVRYCR